MSKERLERIKEVHQERIKEDEFYTARFLDVEWLIEQVQELEGILEQDARQGVLEVLYEENILYRKSINLALNHIHTGNFTLATVELNKALLKEVEQ